MQSLREGGVFARIRNEGRLEHLAHELDLAFEEGSLAEFDAWLASGEEGWLFLDSVDEARLGSPADFERAIRRIGARVSAAQLNTHVVISSRGHAWRPISDLALLRRHLPYRLPQAAPNLDQNQLAPQTEEPRANPIRIISLDDLDSKQIKLFAAARKVDAENFVAAIDRADAWSMATRPDDLIELIAFWKDHDRIGDRLELMRSSIRRRLIERDQARADALPLSETDAMDGARMIAAVTTMAQNSRIRVPDGSHNAEGMPAAEILPDWNNKQIAALLTRPIFDDAIYGTVRFHHRTTREFLAAEWFNHLLMRATSTRSIEAVLFRKQYGREVIAPVMRPVLVWLLLLNDAIRKRALSISPELIFDGGEPKLLPLEVRTEILRGFCAKIEDDFTARSSADYRAVQRFASSDIGPEVKLLLAQYFDKPDVVSFLVRMIWQGEIVAALPEAKAVARSAKANHYTRMVAFRAVRIIGTPADVAAICSAVAKEKGHLKRELLAELLEALSASVADVAWLLKCLSKLEPKSRFGSDGLQRSLDVFIDKMDMSLLPAFIEGLHKLIATPPFVDDKYCAISERDGWLMKSAARAMERLVRARDSAALSPAALSILQRLPTAQQHRHWNLSDVAPDLVTLIGAWPSLNDELFWSDIRLAREKREAQRVTKFWQAGLYRANWRFDHHDFERVLAHVESETLLDDKLVALSLAFRLYVDGGRSARLRRRLKTETDKEPALQQELHDYLHPPRQDDTARHWKQTEARWKREQKTREAREEKSETDAKTYILANVAKIRDHGLTPTNIITNAQHYLHQKMGKAGEDANHWAQSNWQSLEAEFGADVARAMRDAMVAYWRRNTPLLRSSGKGTDGTPLSTIFGLSGLAIEAREADDWAKTLNVSEAQLAACYAMDELNGFPNWFQGLYQAWPAIVKPVILGELDYNLKIETAKDEYHYVLSDLAWSATWTWKDLGPEILARLEKRAPKHPHNLEQMLSMLGGSSVTDVDIATLAKKRTADPKPENAGKWFAVWAGVEPTKAIPALRRRLARTQSDKPMLAMSFLTALAGSRRDSLHVRDAFRTVPHLKDLYLLMQRYVRQKDDIDRANKGVYSPTIRDNAQDARHHLFSLLNQIPGKEAYVAIEELGRLHPDASSRPWMMHHAKTKAEADADLTAWSIRQTRDFQKSMERTPATHRELFDLAQLRFNDLKHKLENGDASIAKILIDGATKETLMRTYIGDWMREHARGRFVIPQEEELADAKRPDLRVHGVGFDAPVPVELKLADRWSGNKLFERLDAQLCGDYLRDERSRSGLFVLVHRGGQDTWQAPNRAAPVTFTGLVDALQDHWQEISNRHPGVDDIEVIGIDLTARSGDGGKKARKKSKTHRRT